MSTIVGVQAIVGAHTYSQSEITEAFVAFVAPSGAQRGLVERIHTATGVQQRHLALPLAEYSPLKGSAGGAFDLLAPVGIPESLWCQVYRWCRVVHIAGADTPTTSRLS